MRYAPDRNAPTFLAPANESARHSPKKGIFVRVSEAGENYLEHAVARNPVMPERKKNHAKADRAWAGLRAPQIWQTPRRDGRRTGDEKHGAADWLPVFGVHSFSDERRRPPSRASSLTKTTHLAGNPRS